MTNQTLRHAFVLACAALFPALACAKPIYYVCDMTRGQVGEWLPDKVVVGYEPGKDTALVADGIIYHFNEDQPIEARVSVDNAKRLSIAWDIDVRDKTGDRAIMNFTLTIRKAEMQASISNRANAFNFAKSAGGSCKLEQER